MPDHPKLWFLRHGQTDWNAAGRIQGRLESDLNAQGRRDAAAQAELLRPVLAGGPPCFVSPQRRAQQTARIALADAPFQTDARLAEAHAGAWQGLLRTAVTRDNPGRVTAQMSALELFLIAPGGEGFDAFLARITSFLRDLRTPSVIVAHGLLGQVLRGVVCGLDRAEMGALPNLQGCVYVLEDGREACLMPPG